MDLEHLLILVLNKSDIALAILLIVDITAYWLGRRHTKHPERRGYGLKDTATNVSLELANGFILRFTEVLGGAALVVVAAQITPLHWGTSNPVAWLIVLLLADLAYYWEHRAAHRVRLFWTTHSVHHSSQNFNLTTNYRLGLFGAMDLLGQLWYVPIALLGAPVQTIFLAKSLTILVQIPLHTERVNQMWRPIEYLFNTPSHHRVHHGANNPYLDKNFGGMFIFWDRLFGTYAHEVARVEFGLVHPVGSHNPLKVYTHEIRALAGDLRHARGPREWAGYLFGPPGWQPRRVAVAESEPTVQPAS
ncbi:sterol desaturase family protein [Nocardia panacis]|uniref:Sterol desaturase family protein n=1 Tax=Nocardia panacis TaxID=2340916 RepID=A0A3A4K0V1_9NOCA|nr:sterol desaturase family protein [Nocardia panacis]RJO70933.1 sterol desaturase family protein [Nocardia panacis]